MSICNYEKQVNFKPNVILMHDKIKQYNYNKHNLCILCHCFDCQFPRGLKIVDLCIVFRKEIITWFLFGID